MRFIRTVIAVLVLVVAAPSLLYSQAPTPAAAAAPLYNQAQLDQLLAPIALYPDALLAPILMATTYPLEVVEAARWVQDPAHANLRGDQLAAALQSEDWDPSVKSLVPFPQVLRMMDSRLDWLQQVGDAFLAQQSDVMDAVQRLRRKAEAAGKLRSSPQQTVTDQDQTITIEPANPEIVYVPVYDPTLVYGVWPYPGYPPYYFALPGVILGPPWFLGWWWGPAISVGFFAPYWGWGHCDWHHHEIHIDQDRFDRLGGRGHPIGPGGTWQHDPYHRRGVAYRGSATIQRFAPAGTTVPDARRSFRGFTGPSSAPTTQNRGTLFDRSGTGADSQIHSQRGHASQQTFPSAPSAPSRSFGGGGGASHGGGGGGASHGGGGGGGAFGGGHR